MVTNSYCQLITDQNSKGFGLFILSDVTQTNNKSSLRADGWRCAMERSNPRIKRSAFITWDCFVTLPTSRPSSPRNDVTILRYKNYLTAY